MHTLMLQEALWADDRAKQQQQRQLSELSASGALSDQQVVAAQALLQQLSLLGGQQGTVGLRGLSGMLPGMGLEGVHGGQPGFSQISQMQQRPIGGSPNLMAPGATHPEIENLLPGLSLQAAAEQLLRQQQQQSQGQPQGFPQMHQQQHGGALYSQHPALEGFRQQGHLQQQDPHQMGLQQMGAMSPRQQQGLDLQQQQGEVDTFEPPHMHQLMPNWAESLHEVGATCRYLLSASERDTFPGLPHDCLSEQLKLCWSLE